MKVLLIGSGGQLGWELQRCLPPLGEIKTIDYPEINLLYEDQIRSWVREKEPDLIINAAAYTAVDDAESNKDQAMAINGVAPGVLAEEAKSIGAALIHYSTDYVYDGTKTEPYIESDQPNPINTYGWSKLAGDQNVQQVAAAYLIFRTSWVYSVRNADFVQKVLEWARKKQTLKIVKDQVGSPTWARMLAEVTAQLLAKADRDIFGWINERRGLYHLGGEGIVSRLEWAKTILQLDPNAHQQLTKQVLEAKTSEFSTPAKRPLYTPLNCDLFANTFGLRLPDWEQALCLAMKR